MTEKQLEKTSNTLSRREFLYLQSLLAVGIPIAAGLKILNQDETFVTHVKGIVDAAHAAYLQGESSLANEATLEALDGFYGQSQEEWLAALEPGFQVVAEEYFGVDVDVLINEYLLQVTKLETDPKLALLALSYWGKYKLVDGSKIVQGEVVDTAQTTLSRVADLSNRLRQFWTADTKILKWIPQYMRTKSVIQLRTVGIKDNDAPSYARAIIASDQNPESHWSPSILLLCKKLVAIGEKMYAARPAGIPYPGIPETEYDQEFLALGRKLENYIVTHAREIPFGLQLFTIISKHQENLLLSELGIDNLAGLNDTQIQVCLFLHLGCLDVFSKAQSKYPHNPKLDGQFFTPEAVMPALVNYFIEEVGLHPLDIDTPKKLDEVLSLPLWQEGHNFNLKNAAEFIQFHKVSKNRDLSS